jgi:putative protease
MAEKKAGKVEHYYPKVQAAAVKLTKKVKVGDQVHIVGHGDDFKEKVTSLQLDHEPIQEGKPGQSVGLWVKERVHEGDDVLLVEPDKAKPKKAAKPKARKAKPKRAKAKRAKPSRKASKKAPRRKAKARKAKSKPKKGKRKSSRKRR